MSFRDNKIYESLRACFPLRELAKLYTIRAKKTQKATA